MPPSCQSEDLAACLPATSYGWLALLPSLHIWPSGHIWLFPQAPCTPLAAIASCRCKDGAAVRLTGGCSATLADGVFWDVSVRGALAALQGRSLVPRMLSAVGSPASRPTVLLSAAHAPSIADPQSTHSSIAAGRTFADNRLQVVS